MGQYVDQIHAAADQEVAQTRDQTFMAKLQSARQSALDRKASIDEELADYEGEIAARTPQAEQPQEGQPEQQPQG